MTITLMLGNCLDKMKDLDDNSVDSIVTDPPYGLSFMGKKWDYDVPSTEIWEEAFRVLKPGGYLLAFAGTRTQHRMAIRIEDAGFEIRDMIAWVYGSGFPKSMNISKAIDKAAGAERTIKRGIKAGHEDFADRKTKGHLSGENKNEGWARPWMEAENANDYHYDFEPATDEAKQWEGWGTALKPALEPITVARKPLEEKNVAANVLKYGTGGINIDASRVSIDPEVDVSQIRTLNRNVRHNDINGQTWGLTANKNKANTSPQLIQVVREDGRFPANFIHDGSDEVVSLFPYTKSGKLTSEQQKNAGFSGKNDNGIYGRGSKEGGSGFYKENEGSAARFFYCPKTSKTDRNEGLDAFEEKSIGGKGNGIRRVCSKCGASALEADTCHCEEKDWINPSNKKNNHPTVKPTELMKYLVRMVTPKDGTVLDPFMGSGSTGKAAKMERFNFIGIELDAEYFEIAKARIDAVKEETTLEEFFK